MNVWAGIGRTTKEADVRQAGESMVARFTLAVDRRFKKDNGDNTDFINCVAFGKTAEFIDKYFHKGIKVAVTGRIQAGSYTNKEGQKIYTTDVVVENTEFCERKASGEKTERAATPSSDGFMHIPEDFTGDALPFN